LTRSFQRVRTLGLCGATFAAIALSAGIAAVPASATSTATIYGCYTSYTSSGGYAYCNRITVNADVWASANCYNWPGDVGGSAYLDKGSSDGPFSHIGCTTHITKGFINVQFGDPPVTHTAS